MDLQRASPERLVSPSHLLVAALVLVILLAAASAVFSAIETALFLLQPYHIARLKARRASFAAALAKLIENPRRLLSAILFADALVNLPLVLVCLILLREMRGAPIPFWAAAFLIFTVVVFACDLVPKVAALADPYRFTKIGVRVLQTLLPLIDPVARVLQRVSEKLAEHLTPSGLHGQNFLNEEELETLIDLSAEEGALHAVEREMIHEIIKLGEKTAKDCMTPRVDAFAVPDDLTHEELIPRLRAKRLRRVPVYGATPDDVLGILNVQDFLLRPQIHYTEQLSAPSFVPETMKAIDLLRSFLQHPQGLAIVVDEHGGMEGIVTLADVVEEIISDAVPRAEEALYIETLANGRLLVNGNARLDDLNDLLHVRLEEDGIDTIGGLIFNRLGTLPKPGSQLDLEGLSLTIRRTSRKRIEEVLVVQHAPALHDEGEKEEAL